MQALETLEIRCPYCGELQWISVERMEVSQEYLEDCQVCCRAMGIRVEACGEGEIRLQVSAVS